MKITIARDQYVVLDIFASTCANTHSWERRVDPQGRVYYVDHNRKTTSWQPPTAQNIQNYQHWQQQQQGSNLQTLRELHQQRYLLVSCQCTNWATHFQCCDSLTSVVVAVVHSAMHAANDLRLHSVPVFQTSDHT